MIQILKHEADKNSVSRALDFCLFDKSKSDLNEPVP